MKKKRKPVVRKRRKPRRRPLRLELLRKLAEKAADFEACLPALMASIEADKSRLAFFAARTPILESENAGLRAHIKELEITIATLGTLKP